jgi:hypothetical protein
LVPESDLGANQGERDQPNNGGCPVHRRTTVARRRAGWAVKTKGFLP